MLINIWVIVIQWLTISHYWWVGAYRWSKAAIKRRDWIKKLIECLDSISSSLWGGAEMVTTLKVSIHFGRRFEYQIFPWDRQWPSQEKIYTISNTGWGPNLRPWATQIIPQVSIEKNGLLTAPYSEEEVKKAVFQMEHNKASGTDGFPAEFY
jgi:hypothetical protein